MENILILLLWLLATYLLYRFIYSTLEKFYNWKFDHVTCTIRIGSVLGFWFVGSMFSLHKLGILKYIIN